MSLPESQTFFLLCIGFLYKSAVLVDIFRFLSLCIQIFHMSILIFLSEIDSARSEVFEWC